MCIDLTRMYTYFKFRMCNRSHERAHVMCMYAFACMKAIMPAHDIVSIGGHTLMLNLSH